LSFQVVLTKIDKLGAAERAAIAGRVGAELKAHAAAHPEIHLTSAEKGLGIAALRAAAAQLAAARRQPVEPSPAAVAPPHLPR